MSTNKIILNNEVLIDLTADTVTSETLAKGVIAHDKNGAIITGAAVVPSGSTTITANGTHDIANYTSAEVNVEPALQEQTLTISASGTYEYTPGADYYGISKITFVVDVPQVASPTIALDGDTLSIASNDEKAEVFLIFMNGAEKETVSEGTFDLSTWGLSAGVYNVTVKARAAGYADSAESNAVNYVSAVRLVGSDGYVITDSEGISITTKE